MSAYTPDDSADGKSFIVSKTTDVSTINSYIFGGHTYKMTATSVTTVVEFRGLSRSEAHDMAEDTDYNYSNKHGVRFRGTSAWMAVPECEGVVCRADSKRINEADMHRVTVTHISTTVSHSSDWDKETF